MRQYIENIFTTGLYMFGGVGCGKTFIMDIFFACARVQKKRRTHFHAFMLEVNFSHYLYTCIYTHLYIYTYIYTYAYTYPYTYIYIYIYTHICIYIFTHVYVFSHYIYTHIYTYTYIYTYVYTYLYTYIYIYIYIHVYIYIHTCIYICSIYIFNIYVYSALKSLYAENKVASRLLGKKKSRRGKTYHKSYRSLLQNIVSFIGLFAKETHNFKEPTNRSHPLWMFSCVCMCANKFSRAFSSVPARGSIDEKF